jgi:UDPglucose 6-dehydrogenase
MKISIIGTGYVGLVSGACFADVGNAVLCLDVNEDKIAMLKNGVIPIHEPGLDQLVARNASAGRLFFSTSYDEAIAHADLVFLAVGTPPDEDGSADLTHILAAARSIGQRMERPLVVVDKSTVPVGTADKVRAAIQGELDKRGSAMTFAVVSNPEFLKEGAAIEDFMRPDRIVVGSDDAVATKRRACHQADAPTVCTFQPQPRKTGRDGCAQRRADQICRQLDAGHPHQFHERTGQPG